MGRSTTYTYLILSSIKYLKNQKNADENSILIKYQANKGLNSINIYIFIYQMQKEPGEETLQKLQELNIQQQQQAPRPQQENEHDEHQHSEEEQQQEGLKWEKIEQPEKALPLFMVDFEQCDSKKCTGKKMERFKLLTNIKDRKKKFKGVVLSAFGKKIISKEDLEYCEKYGVCVIDCSWNRIEQTRQFRYKHERKLPFVTAGNPVNFGKPYQLSCVEAMATALCAIGYVPQAKYIMSKFGWSDGFWKQNPNIMAYGKCQTTEEIAIVSKENEEALNQGFVRNYDFDQDEDDQDAQS